jgi:hypothetical protein
VFVHCWGWWWRSSTCVRVLLLRMRSECVQCWRIYLLSFKSKRWWGWTLIWWHHMGWNPNALLETLIAFGHSLYAMCNNEEVANPNWRASELCVIIGVYMKFYWTTAPTNWRAPPNQAKAQKQKERKQEKGQNAYPFNKTHCLLLPLRCHPLWPKAVTTTPSVPFSLSLSLPSPHQP